MRYRATTQAALVMFVLVACGIELSVVLIDVSPDDMARIEEAATLAVPALDRATSG